MWFWLSVCLLVVMNYSNNNNKNNYAVDLLCIHKYTPLPSSFIRNIFVQFFHSIFCLPLLVYFKPCLAFNTRALYNIIDCICRAIQAIVLPTTISICTSMYGKIAFQNCINQVKIKLFVRMTGAYLKKRTPIQSSIFVELT